ncbi:MAG TPA: DUF4038 domain-containing protein, partial [Polyangiales bacterium]
PFPILGDSGWEVPHNLVPADQSVYLSDRAGRGFNAVIVEAIEHKFTSKKPPRDFANNLPFTKRLDQAAYTGSPNGTESTSGTGIIVAGPTYAADPYDDIEAEAPDFTTPNSAYWSELDAFITRAREQGILVLLFPAYVGWDGADEGWMQELRVNDAVIGAGGFAGQPWSNAGRSKVWNYGAWLAQRFASHTNILWVLGGDYGDLSEDESAALGNLLAGMKSVSSQQSRLWTAHWARPSYGSDVAEFAGAMDLESVYVNASSASQTRTGYAQATTKPAFMIEGLYEGNPAANGPVRRLQWWSLFGTPAGQFFGSTSLWSVGTGWRAALDTPDTRDQTRLNGFVRSIPWHTLVPSGLNGQKTIAVSNGSTASRTDYVACAAGPTVAACYVPSVWARGTLGIDASVLSGPFRARWFNPTTAAYTLISNSMPNSGTATFTPPGNNGSGAKDWVLLLDVQTAAPGNAAPAFSAPAASSANPVTSTSSTLSALASDDGGEAALSYSWSVTGTPPAPVAFSINASNAAKSTTASFSKAGQYALQVTATDAQGASAVSSLTVSVTQTASALVVSPGSATVAPGGSQTFTAGANDQFGQPISPAPSASWSVSGGGTISTSGVFSAGSSAGGPYTVTATASGRQATASVTVTSTPTQPQQFQLGQTTVLPYTDSNNGGWLIAQAITLPRTAQIRSLSFYVQTPAGRMRLGLYDASGSGQTPGRKLAETAELTPTATGWLSAPVNQTATLAAGKYWLVYFSSSNSLRSRRSDGGGQSRYYQLTYGALPATFAAGSTADDVLWSFYGTFEG